MRNVKSLSSLSTLAVGTTVVSTSASAFSSSVVPSYLPRMTHKSHSALFTLSNASPGENPIPPAATISETVLMTSAEASRLSQLPQEVVPTSPFLSAAVMKSMENNNGDEYSMTGATSLLEAFVPPGKSLRQKLQLPSNSAAATNTQILRPRIVGHRGALYQELENTRAAFLACAGNCDAVELDVFVLPKDNSLIVFHGSGTDQNPGLLKDYCIDIPQGVTSILDLTYEETQHLRFNPNFAELPAPAERILAGKIPTLEHVLIDLKPTGMEVKIELKGMGTAKPTIELVDRLGMANQVSFSSFNHDEIDTVRKMKPEMKEDGTYVYRTGALFDTVPVDYIQRAQIVGASEIHLKYDDCTTERISNIHKSGMGSMCWFRGPIGMKADTTSKYWDIGNEDEVCYETLIQTGVQQLCVNKPDVLAGLLRRKEQEQVQQQQQQQSQMQLVENILSSGMDPLDVLGLESPPSNSQRVSA